MTYHGAEVSNGLSARLVFGDANLILKILFPPSEQNHMFPLRTKDV